MNNLDSEPRLKFGNEVHTTTDYFLFKSVEGNRNKSKVHINRLKKSMSENYLFTIITVNEKYEIIDGQHRFEAIKELGLPMYYVVCKDYGLDEVHIFNKNNQTWIAQDYLDGYCMMRFPHYLKYAEFKERYGFGHGEILSILGKYANGTSKDRTNIFYSGDFQVGDYENSCKIADRIEAIGEFYTGYKRRSFVTSMLQLFKNKNFDFSEFIQKLKTQPTALVDCTSNEQYVNLIEGIYNYRRREKVNLRY